MLKFYYHNEIYIAKNAFCRKLVLLKMLLLALVNFYTNSGTVHQFIKNAICSYVR